MEDIWWMVNRIDNQNGKFRKKALLSYMRGQAFEMTCAEGTDTWNNSPDLTNHLETFWRIFLPPEESELARSGFKARKQGCKEDISTHLSAKIYLWQLT